MVLEKDNILEKLPHHAEFNLQFKAFNKTFQHMTG